MSCRHASRWLCFAWLALAACQADGYRDLASDRPRDAAQHGGDAALDARTLDAAGDAQAPDAASDGGRTQPVARCGNAPCACDDGLDNDGDHLIDGLDPECTGALDEDEATFATGKPPKAKNCRDCFWDENMGTGNDVCRYPTACLRGASPTGAGNCSSCEVSQACVDTCAMRTPSGCDCFGCCDIELPDGQSRRVELSEKCSLAKLDDPVACPPCWKSTQCANPCGRCELCPGRTIRDLPADCAASVNKSRCEDGLKTPCADSTECGVDQYCQQGCCYGLLL
ncbi:MAG TPA: hypothetical protein VJR89_17835 [Polyangiales bacterium]|nr:hypothetical protein [Polyangiales bacterium]